MRLRSLLPSLIVLLVLLAGGAAALSTDSIHWPRWLIGAIAAGVATIVGIVKPVVDMMTKARVDRLSENQTSEKRLGETLKQLAGSREGLPLIGSVKSHAVLGIHPAIPLPADADPSLSSELPIYVPRDCDPDIRATVTRMSVTGGFLLLVGEPAAGKTRCGIEAIRVLPADWRIFVRTGTFTLQQLIDTGVPLARTVIWLDDIHQLLDTDPSDPNHLAAATVRRLLLPDAGPIIILATTWTDRRDRYSELPVNGTSDLMSDARALIGMAQQFDIDATFSDDEWARAYSMSAADPRLAEAVATGKSKTLAATLLTAMN